MILRPARMEDALLLLAWRNDPLTRAMSISPDEVRLDDHCAWLARTIANPARLLLIALLGDEPIGTIRLDYGEETEMSWTVAPAARGRGLGRRMVIAAADQLLADAPDGVTAVIKRDNAASQHIAMSAGFHLVRDGELQHWARQASRAKAA